MSEQEKTSKKVTQAQFEKKVLELAKAGLTAEKIGEKLRQEEIHSKEYSKKISKILKEKEMYTDPDMKNVESKLSRIEIHSKSNKQDKRAIRERSRVFSQVRKLKKYRKLIANHMYTKKKIEMKLNKIKE